jgi:hypothetical protein
MGMEKSIPFAGNAPTWPSIQQTLVQAGHAVQMRMIDNMPAFPDEDPPEDWRELRVSLGGGMITLRRSANALSVVVWGNADAQLQAHQEALVKACEAVVGV